MKRAVKDSFSIMSHTVLIICPLSRQALRFHDLEKIELSSKTVPRSFPRREKFRQGPWSDGVCVCFEELLVVVLDHRNISLVGGHSEFSSNLPNPEKM